MILMLRRPRVRRVGGRIVMLRYVLKSRRSGAVLGYHPTRESALRQERAIQLRMKIRKRM